MHDEKDPTKVVRPAGQQVSGYGELRDDGSTMCGNWLHSGVDTEAGNNAQRRNNERDPMDFAKRIQAAHGEMVRLLTDKANRARAGVHADWGEVDAAHVAAYQARHAHEHVTDVAKRFPPSN